MGKLKIELNKKRDFLVGWYLVYHVEYRDILGYFPKRNLAEAFVKANPQYKRRVNWIDKILSKK